MSTCPYCLDVVHDDDTISVTACGTAWHVSCKDRHDAGERTRRTVADHKRNNPMSKISGKLGMDPTITPPRAKISAEAPRNDSVDAILAERGARYGKFEDHARIAGILKHEMRQFRRRGETTPMAWDGLAYDQQEALEMIAHKIGRILNGDPNYPDNFLDIAGYATLVAKRLQGVVQ